MTWEHGLKAIYVIYVRNVNHKSTQIYSSRGIHIPQ